MIRVAALLSALCISLLTVCSDIASEQTADELELDALYGQFLKPPSSAILALFSN